jgi:hypothetical protein
MVTLEEIHKMQDKKEHETRQQGLKIREQALKIDALQAEAEMRKRELSQQKMAFSSARASAEAEMQKMAQQKRELEMKWNLSSVWHVFKRCAFL